jgi:hypothetical protein
VADEVGSEGVGDGVGDGVLGGVVAEPAEGSLPGAGDTVRATF